MKNAKIKSMVYRYWRKPTTKGYNRKGYNFNKSVSYYKRTGYFKTVAGGSGHDAGYKWAEKKTIDPSSRVQRYSKNSPSFDEGVYKYKEDKRSKMAEMASRVK